MQTHAFVWISDPPDQRLTHVYFRRTFSLSDRPVRAEISLFAQTHYHLRVNGVMIGTGPARSHPDFPEYDTYDLAPHLTQGENVVAVQVAHEGLSTFHHLSRPGALCAWGMVETADESRTSLSTAEGWTCHLSQAHEPNPPHFSFAIGPIQIFDERKAPAGWDRPGTPTGEWRHPVVVDASAWGELRPRSIPHLTEEERLPKELLGVYRHKTDETVISFFQHQVYDASLSASPPGYMFAYTHIHSPRRQDVTLGTWWGAFYLNGQTIPPADVQPDVGEREDRVFTLAAGWNFLLMSYQIVKGVWEMHLGLPIDAGLTFSADRDPESGVIFRVTPALAQEEAMPVLERLPTDGIENLPELAALWEDRVEVDLPVSAKKSMLWRNLERTSLTARDLTIPAGQGTSLVYDMEQMSLGRIFVEFDAPANSVIEVGYAEDLLECGRPNMQKHSLIHCAERHIARGGSSRMETFARRGFRYLQVDITRHTGDVQITRVGIVSNVYPFRSQIDGVDEAVPCEPLGLLTQAATDTTRSRSGTRECSERAGRQRPAPEAAEVDNTDAPCSPGAFESSDPYLNHLWQYGWNTLQLCAEDVYTDTPWRERTLYGGDLLVEAATTFAVSRDTRLVKRCLELLVQCADPETGGMAGRAPSADSRGKLWGFPMLELICTAWYCRLSGDAAFAERTYPSFDRMMQGILALSGQDNLFHAEDRVFMDHGYHATTGRVCIVNALIAGTFEAWGDLCAIIEREEEAEQARETSRRTSACVVDTFWDEEARTFADVLPIGGKQQEYTAYPPAWVLLFCNVPQDKQTGALRRVAERMPGFDPMREESFISAYNSFYLLGGLYKAGAAGLAEESMRTVYREMIEHSTGTTWEHANAEKSLSHAWASAPTFYLSTQVLGVDLGFPNSRKTDEILIAPQSEGLSWACGTVPHPLGDVHVSWEVQDGVLLLEYSAPVGVEVNVSPRGRLGRLRPKITRTPHPA